MSTEEKTTRYNAHAYHFVNGLRAGIQGTPLEPCGITILSQWLLESGHFKSDLARLFCNPGGIQYRKGFTGKHWVHNYTDWQGVTRKHFGLFWAEDFFSLYLWFISGEGRFPEHKNPYLAAARYITETPKHQVDPGTWLKLLAGPYVASMDGIKREDYKTQAEYDEAVDEKYTQKVIEISKREATRDLYEHKWLENTASMFHRPNNPIYISEKQVQDDWPEWLLGPKP